MDLQPLRRHLRIHLAALGFSALYGLAIRVGIALSVIDRLGQRFASIKPWLTNVLEGEYRLESQPDGSTLLRLISRERVSTHFNPYAGMWTDAVVRSIQSSILDVIRNRCEHEMRQTASAGE